METPGLFYVVPYLVPGRHLPVNCIKQPSLTLTIPRNNCPSTRVPLRSAFASERSDLIGGPGLAEGQNRSLAAGSATFHQPRKAEARLRPENIVIARSAVRRNSRKGSPTKPCKAPAPTSLPQYFSTDQRPSCQPKQQYSAHIDEQYNNTQRMSFRGLQKGLARVSCCPATLPNFFFSPGQAASPELTADPATIGAPAIQGQVQHWRAHQGRRLHRLGTAVRRARGRDEAPPR